MIRDEGELAPRLAWDQEIAGSNPVIPTHRDSTQPGRSTVEDTVLIRRRRRFDSRWALMQVGSVEFGVRNQLDHSALRIPTIAVVLVLVRAGGC